VITNSAVRSSSTARTVSRSGSPGPLPTNDTKPTGCAEGTEASVTAFADALRAAEVFLVAVLPAFVSVGVLLTVAFLFLVVGCVFVWVVLMTPAPR
jgi:hypothetical protein